MTTSGRPERVAGFLADNVRNLASEAGLTIEALARESNVSERTVYNVLGGRVDTRLSTIVLLSEVLDCSPDTLLLPPAGVLRKRLEGLV